MLKQLLIGMFISAALVWSSGCGPDDHPPASPTSDAGPPSGDGNPDDPPLPPAGEPPLPQRFEFTSAAARLKGGGYGLDVQIGHGFAQRPTSGGDSALQSAAAIR